VWFADYLAGNCIGVNCQNLDLSAFQEAWTGHSNNLTAPIRQRFYGVEQVFQGMTYRSYVDKYFGQANPLVLGMQFDRAGLYGLMARSLESGYILPTDFPISAGDITPFQSASMLWHADAAVPHFDFAFNTKSSTELQTILPVGVCQNNSVNIAMTTCLAAQIALQTVNPALLPPNYVSTDFPMFWQVWRLRGKRRRRKKSYRHTHTHTCSLKFIAHCSPFLLKRAG
jgi:hypothetical protein